MRVKTKNKNALGSMCVGCKHNTIKSGKEFICNRPGMGPTEVAAAVIDSFFGGCCKGYEPTTTARP